MKIKEPVPEEAMKAQAITLPPLCFRWACMFGIMSRSFFLPTLAFPSLWSIKSVHKTLSQNFWGSSPILLANEWFASPGVASVLLFMKSSANSRLWYLHSCPLKVVADVTNSCFRVFLYSCHNVSVVNCWCFLDLPIRGVLLSTPVVSFFLRRFQMVVLAIASVCAMVWLIFHLLSASQLLVLHP